MKEETIRIYEIKRYWTNTEEIINDFKSIEKIEDEMKRKISHKNFCNAIRNGLRTNNFISIGFNDSDNTKMHIIEYDLQANQEESYKTYFDENKGYYIEVKK